VNNILVSGEIENHQMIDSQPVDSKAKSDKSLSSKSARKSLARQNLSSRRSDNKTLKKKRLSGTTLKNHLKYIVPELKLALIKEPGVKPHAIHGPQEIEHLIEPMKFYPDYVPKLNMCRRWQQAHPVRGGALALRHINFKANPTISAALHPLSNEHQRDMFHLT